MPGFLSSLQERAQQGLTQAQAALDKKGYDFKIPSGMTTHTTQAQQPLDQQGNPYGAGGSSDQADGKSRPFFVENITHQLRSLHNQYGPQGPPEVQKLQVLITNAKGVALDFEAVGRDTKGLSKDLFLWGQAEEEDLKDVTDRLAYAHFVNGTLSTNLSDRLDEARAPFKKLREAQSSLAPRRAQRSAIEADIKRAQGNAARVQDLHQTLQKHVADDQPLERELGELKRLAIRDSERKKWEAIREYAEKLLLVSQAANQIIDQLPTTVPTPNTPYNGHKATAGARTALEAAIDNYRPGSISLQTGGSNFDSRSFGESHASELSRVSSFSSPVGPTPQAQVHPQYTGEAPGQGVGGFSTPRQQSSSGPATSQSPLNPAQLNNTPAAIPATSSNISSSTSQAHTEAPAAIISPSAASEGQVASTAPIQPTVAETGIPLSAGAGGPGPASGSLSRDGPPPSIDAPSYDTPGVGVGGFRSDVGGSAEDEKKRLAREERERVLAAAPAPTAYPSAEDEKKKLEREERERILRGEASGGDGGPPKPSGTPPPYS